MQQTTYGTNVFKGPFEVGLVNFETSENHVSHETQGLSKNHLVVRRGQPFKVTLLFKGRVWDPYHERLVLEVRLGSLSCRFPVSFFEGPHPQLDWSAVIYPGDRHSHSASVHICSPVLSSVGLYQLLVHTENAHRRTTYMVGTFVLLCNPWLKDDPVFMPLDVHLQEYIKSDYGLVYMGTPTNVHERLWLFGQYEPGVLEACLKLLQVSNQHLENSQKDYILRADPVYLSRVVCAMVNSNDDLGVVLGRWEDDYRDGVKPTDWCSSADILRQWLSSGCKPVRYGQCWVFASVLCTVLRALGIPSRVVTVFNAAHDTDGNTTVDEYYTSSGEKLSLTKDSIWNFHVWVECWMRRFDLSAEFDGWQVVDPTPQEKSGGVFCCGPCPVAAIQRCINVPFDTRFLYAAVDADVHRVILRNGQVVGETLSSQCVGQLICTKSIGWDRPQDLTMTYKSIKRAYQHRTPQHRQFLGDRRSFYKSQYGLHVTSSVLSTASAHTRSSYSLFPAQDAAGDLPSHLEVSVVVEGSPLLGENINLCVTITNHSSRQRALLEHINAQLKAYNRNPHQSFWSTQKEVSVRPQQVLTLHHTILYSEYESILKLDSLVNVGVVLQDMRTNERVLDAHEFNMSTPQITVQVEGGDNIQVKKEKTAHVTFINPFNRPLSGVVLSVEGSGLLKGKQEAKLVLLQPGEKIEKKMSIMATSPGTKGLMATLSHSNNSSVVSRHHCRISVISA
ncbi:protein-glutamine gamma-glutamyltransferase 5 [Nothobranchius furzeri]|uniref:protein-glutamine gamma-glutamyltransferase 5 n=1 Tax=Nothobranchius furzeri TaxID=105023 RepID=UPI003904DDE8